MTDKLFKNIDELKFDPGNARKHDERNIKAIMDSLKQNGQRKPIVIYSDMVVAGNGTLEAAKRLGWTKIWVNNDPFESIEHAKAYALQDNKSAELAAWDTEQLATTIKELDEKNWDIESLGFNEQDIKEILGTSGISEGLTDEDAISEISQNEMGVRLGDIWQLGNHRLMCGDSTDKATVEKLMNGEKADMVFTDPPYGMNLDTDYTSSMDNGYGFKSTHKYKKVAGDDSDFDFMKSYALVEEIKEQFWFGGDYYAKHLPNGGSWIVWDRANGNESFDKMIGSAFELCWSKQKHKRDLARVTWKGCFGHNKKDDGPTKVHPTMKPVKLIEWFFDRFKGKNVIDLFLGSGSTLIACEKTGRKCYGMEIDEHYCSVIIKRWQDFTGKEAVKLTV